MPFAVGRHEDHAHIAQTGGGATTFLSPPAEKHSCVCRFYIPTHHCVLENLQKTSQKIPRIDHCCLLSNSIRSTVLPKHQNKNSKIFWPRSRLPVSFRLPENWHSLYSFCSCASLSVTHDTIGSAWEEARGTDVFRLRERERMFGRYGSCVKKMVTEKLTCGSLVWGQWESHSCGHYGWGRCRGQDPPHQSIPPFTKPCQWNADHALTQVAAQPLNTSEALLELRSPQCAVFLLYPSPCTTLQRFPRVHSSSVLSETDEGTWGDAGGLPSLPPPNSKFLFQINRKLAKKRWSLNRWICLLKMEKPVFLVRSETKICRKIFF